MFKRFLALALVAALSVLAAAPHAAHAAGPADWPTTLKLGVIPTEGAADSAARFETLAAHLSKVLGVKVEVFTASDYAGVITAMANKHIDFAYFGPKSYTEAAEKAGAEAVVLEMDADKQLGYNGIVIVKRGSGIKDLAAAKGHTFAFTDPNSTSGFLVPNVLFARDLKVKPEEYFKEVRFSGSHGASILAVKNGGVEVAATNNIDLDRMIEKGSVSKDDFDVLWTSELIPGSPMAARADLPSSLKAAFAGALMKFNSDKEGLKKMAIGGYAFADDTTYDIIRYLSNLKKQLAAKK